MGKTEVSFGFSFLGLRWVERNTKGRVGEQCKIQIRLVFCNAGGTVSVYYVGAIWLRLLPLPHQLLAHVKQAELDGNVSTQKQTLLMSLKDFPFMLPQDLTERERGRGGHTLFRSHYILNKPFLTFPFTHGPSLYLLFSTPWHPQ